MLDALVAKNATNKETMLKPLIFSATKRQHTFYSVFRADLDAEDPLNAAIEDYRRYSALGSESLLQSHITAMGELWTGGIEVSGNLTVAASINSSLYYLLT